MKTCRNWEKRANTKYCTMFKQLNEIIHFIKKTFECTQLTAGWWWLKVQIALVFHVQLQFLYLSNPHYATWKANNILPVPSSLGKHSRLPIPSSISKILCAQDLCFKPISTKNYLTQLARKSPVFSRNTRFPPAFKNLCLTINKRNPTCLRLLFS